METIQIIQKASAMGNWWLTASSRQCASSSSITSHADCFGETSNHPGDSAPLQPRFGDLWFLAFLQTKTTFEIEEISDCQWDSGKYEGASNGSWENCVRSQGAYFEGTEASLSYVQCFLYLVFSSINASIFHITWLGTFRTDLVYLVGTHGTKDLTKKPGIIFFCFEIEM